MLTAILSLLLRVFLGRRTYIRSPLEQPAYEFPPRYSAGPPARTGCFSSQRQVNRDLGRSCRI